MLRLRDGEILLRAESSPFVHENACAPAAGDFYGIIDAAGVDDHNLTGERRRRETPGKLRGSIAGDDTEA